QVAPTVATNVAIRGITADITSAYRMDGALSVATYIDIPMEDKERIEVLKGVSSLYYGFVPPAGIINMVMKRPTKNPLSEITLFGNQHGTAGVHLDISRRFADEKMGARFNFVQSELDYGIN